MCRNLTGPCSPTAGEPIDFFYFRHISAIVVRPEKWHLFNKQKRKFLTFIILFSSTELPTEEGKCRTSLSVTCTDFGPCHDCNNNNDDTDEKLFRQANLERIWRRWRWRHYCWHIFFVVSLASCHLKIHSLSLVARCYIIYCCCNKIETGVNSIHTHWCSLWFRTNCLLTDNMYERRRKKKSNGRSETNDTTIQFVIMAVFLSHHTYGSRPPRVFEIYLTGKNPHTKLNLNTQVDYFLSFIQLSFERRLECMRRGSKNSLHH